MFKGKVFSVSSGSYSDPTHLDCEEKWLFEVSNLTVEFKEGKNSVIRPLQDVSLNIPAGVITAIIGESGSGKTTFLRVLGGLLKPTRGSVCFFPEPGSPKPIDYRKERFLNWYRSQCVGWVFQDLNLISHLTVAKNVALPLFLKGMEWSAATKDIFPYLEDVGLSERANKLPSILSGGEQQRIAIARALATKAPIILADEPTGNLDANNSNLVLKSLQSASKRGTSIVLVTHEESLAKEYCSYFIRCEKTPEGGRTTVVDLITKEGGNR